MGTMTDITMGNTEIVLDLSSDEVQTKYRDAATIANNVLKQVIAGLAPGRKIADVCEEGDNLIVDACNKVYQKKRIEKGIAFPTCVSVNEIIGHYSPLKGESPELKEGDVVKVDLGVHIDGFCALAAHTVVLTSETVTGSTADVITAAHQAAEIALRLLRPGNTNSSITDAIERVAAAYNVTPVHGVQSSLIQPFNLEGDKVIAMNHDPEVKVETSTVELNEVYGIDIAMSTGDGKPRNTNIRTTVYRRNLEISYPLRMKAARWLVSEANKMAPVLPFSLRAMNDEVQVKLGVVEAARHDILLAYPLLQEKPGAITSHFKFTGLVLKNGTFKATGLDLPANIQSDKSLPEDLATLRNTSSYVRKTKGSA